MATPSPINPPTTSLIQLQGPTAQQLVSVCCLFLLESFCVVLFGSLGEHNTSVFCCCCCLFVCFCFVFLGGKRPREAVNRDGLWSRVRIGRLHFLLWAGPPPGWAPGETPLLGEHPARPPLLPDRQDPNTHPYMARSRDGDPSAFTLSQRIRVVAAATTKATANFTTAATTLCSTATVHAGKDECFPACCK